MGPLQIDSELSPESKTNSLLEVISNIKKIRITFENVNKIVDILLIASIGCLKVN